VIKFFISLFIISLAVGCGSPASKQKIAQEQLRQAELQAQKEQENMRRAQELKRLEEEQTLLWDEMSK